MKRVAIKCCFKAGPSATKLYDRTKACVYANGAYFEFLKFICLRFLKQNSVLKLLDLNLLAPEFGI
jgi:hypothetical protein